MKLPVYNQKAKEVGDVEVSDSLFASKINDKVLSQYVFIYLSNQRQSNAHTKNRSEVRGGGKKPWKQKGTGRARVGSNRSPIWRGGGVTFGPTNEVNWKKKTTKSFRASAFRNAFSKLAKEGVLRIIDEIKMDEKKPLTKQALDLQKSFDNAKKITVVTSEKNEVLMNSLSNIKKSRAVLVSELNVYDLLNGGSVLIEQKALDYINRWAK
jgi:large subunit ribosomal protein L4